MRILDHLEMYTLKYQSSTEDFTSLGPPSTILCSKGFWVHLHVNNILCANTKNRAFFDDRFIPRQAVF